ncbi:MAG: helix-turn-helix domain-containing protein [Gaiellaceae bacterium]
MAAKTLLSVRETARLLGVHENTVRNWERKGILRAARLPSGFRRFDRHEVERLRAEIFAPAVEGPTIEPTRRPRGRFVHGDDE